MPDLTVTDGFDPDTVPRYPTLLAEIRQSNFSEDPELDADTSSEDEDGAYATEAMTEYVGIVDGDVVGTGPEMEPVRAAIIAVAARRAGRRLGGGVKAIRVRGHAPNGAVFSLVVTSTGEVYDTTPTLTAAQSVSRPAEVAPTNDNASDSPSPRGKIWRRRRKPRPAPLPTPDLETKKGRPHPIMLVVLGFPLALIIFGVWVLVGRGGEEPVAVKSPGPQQLPVVAPQGYSPVAKWAVKVGNTTGGTSGGVAADARRVYAVTGSADKISAYTASNGVRAWSADLGTSVTTGPALTTVNDREVIAAATTEKLVTLDPKTGEKLGQWKLSGSSSSTGPSESAGLSGSRVVMTATGPLVVGQSNVARVIDGKDLVARVMPAGALPVAPGPDGSLIAVTRDRVYVSTSSTVSGTGMPIAPGSDGNVSVAGWTGTRLVLAYADSSLAADGVRLSAYAAPDSIDGPWRSLWTTGMLASTGISTTAGQSQLPLVTGPAGKWGVFAGVGLDLDTGKTTLLGEQWTTSSIGNDIGFGTGSSQVLSVGPNGIGGHSATSPSTLQAVAPQAVVGSSAYLVTNGGATASWLYALNPLDDAPPSSSAPSTSAPATSAPVLSTPASSAPVIGGGQ